MESSRGRRAWSGRSMALLCFFAVAISLCYARSWRSWDCSGSGCRRSSTALPSLDSGRRRAASRPNQEGWASRSGRQWRRLLAEGPGSYPPRCASKCGECSPCYPVHVAVPPGVPVTTEYYPEAWRCKCGNRLYMP